MCLWLSEGVLMRPLPCSAPPVWWRPTRTSIRRTSCTETSSLRTWCWMWRDMSNWWVRVCKSCVCLFISTLFKLVFSKNTPIVFGFCVVCCAAPRLSAGFLIFVCVCPYADRLWFCQGDGAWRENLLICWYSWVHTPRDHQEPRTWLCSRLLVPWHPDLRAADRKVTLILL